MTRDKQAGSSSQAQTIVDGWETQRRRRGLERTEASADENGCLSDLMLDQLQTGELVAADATLARQHLASCTACSRAATELGQVRDRFLTENLSALAADALARTSSGAEAGPGLSPSWPLWRRRLLPFLSVAGLAAAASVTAAFLLLPGKGIDGDGDGFRRKGSLSLSLFVQHPEETGAAGTGQLHLGEPLHPGDRVRFQVDSDRDGHLTVLAVDGNGTVSVYHPQTGTQESPTAAAGAAALAPISARSRTPLPSAVELDGTLGDEILVAVRCTEPRSVAEVVAATRATFRGGARQHGSGTGGSQVAEVTPNPGAPPLALPCAEARYRITKAPRR